MTAVILGSRSPRRRELLSSILEADRIHVVPPQNSDELTFHDAFDLCTIEERLRRIVQMKHDDVTQQLSPTIASAILKSHTNDSQSPLAVITADTVVIARGTAGTPHVLGQPSTVNWQTEVRNWFRTQLSGATHEVWTCFLISCGDQTRQEIVRSEVTFRELTDAMIEWYLATAESPGKAGGYAIQGHAAALVSGLTGSLTNVIGLPLMEVAIAFEELGIPCLSQ